MNLQERAQAVGTFHMKVINLAGEIVEEYTEHNLIVSLGKEAMTYMVGGGAGWSDKRVNRISFGTDGTPPATGDTAITAPFTKNHDGATFPDPSSVVFDWSLSTAEANGKAIQEFGLLCIDSTLFARRTRAVINKDNTLRLEGTWKIQF